MTFTQAVKMLRRRAKLSQQEVADAIGIARATYIKLENGTREARLDELRKLSQYYEISLQDLADGNIIIEDMNEVELPSVVSEERTDLIPREIAPSYQPEKLRQVLLYILNKVGGKPNVGETVLYKLLY
ncbi:MAG: helix-turn-helix transcriptional regulator, partial [Candidatus Nanoperiomorbus sp.]